jgi:hypothetical protein
MGVEFLGEASRQASDVAQMKAMTTSPGPTIQLLPTVGRESRAAGGTERFDAPGDASNPGVDGDRLTDPEGGGVANVFHHRHHLMSGNVREGDQAT